MKNLEQRKNELKEIILEAKVRLIAVEYEMKKRE